MAESSFPRAGTIAIISVSTIAAAALGYAAYFDHRRRNDPEFRRQLKRDSKRSARMAKEAEAASEKQQKQEILAALESAKNEVPTDPEEMEGFFMSKVAQGEQMISSGADPVETALCFYVALKAYPSPRELINIYDKTVPKPIIDILAQMIAYDSSISMGSSGAPSEDGVNVE